LEKYFVFNSYSYGVEIIESFETAYNFLLYFFTFFLFDYIIDLNLIIDLNQSILLPTVAFTVSP